MGVRRPPGSELDFLVMAPASLRARTLPGLNHERSLYDCYRLGDSSRARQWPSCRVSGSTPVSAKTRPGIALARDRSGLNETPANSRDPRQATWPAALLGPSRFLTVSLDHRAPPPWSRHLMARAHCHPAGRAPRAARRWGGPPDRGPSL